MEIRRNILLTILFLTILSFNFTYAQVKAVNDKGEKIIVYADGTWKYDTEGQETKEEEKPKKEEKNKTPKEEVKKTYTRAEMIAVRDEVTAKYREVRRIREMAQKEEGTLTFKLGSYIQYTEKSRKAGTFPKIDADEILYSQKVEKYKADIAAAKKEQKEASKKEKAYQKMLTYPGEKLVVAYNKMKRKYESKYSEEELADGTSKPKKSWNPAKIFSKDKTPMNPEEAARQDYEKQLDEIKKKNEEELEKKLVVAKMRSERMKQYKTKVSYPKFSNNCELAFDEIDQFTGKRKRATKSRNLFSFVDEGYEAIMKGNGYLVCNGFLSEINSGKEVLLVLDFEVKSTTGKEEFGGFNKGGKLDLMMIDGSIINLKNTQSDYGKVNVGKSNTIFRGYYKIDKSNLKALMVQEVSLARVYWKDGFEDYEIYELDFFREQIQCLKDTK